MKHVRKKEEELMFPSRSGEFWKDFFSVPWFGWYWLLAWGMAVLGLYALWKAGGMCLDKYRFAQESLCAEGKVMGITQEFFLPGRRYGRIPVWAPRVRFLERAGGGEVTFQSPSFLFWSDYSKGDAVRVCYLPEDPENARVADGFIWWPESSTALWLAAFLAAGEITLCLRRDARSAVGG